MSNPEIAIYGMWIAWIVVWHIWAMWTAPIVAKSRAPWFLPFIVASIIGFWLLLSVVFVRGKTPCQILYCQLLYADDNAKWCFAAVAALGFLFMIWARAHIGKLWASGVVTREGHRVVDSGPYAMVRHPIYTGLILAALGTALVKGTALALAGCVVLTIVYVWKARLEEKFLRGELGEAAYDAYARRVPMLVPLGPTS